MNVLSRNFQELVENISLSDDEIQKTKSNAEDVSGFLIDNFENSKTQIIGSFAKSTEICSIIDLVLITSDRINPESIEALLSQNYPQTNGLQVIFTDSTVNILLQIEDEIYFPESFENTTQNDLELIDASELNGRHNTRELIKIVKYWRNINGIDMSSHFIEKVAVEFLSTTYHAHDSYLLYGLMVMRFFKRLLEYDEPWSGDVQKAFEICERAVLSFDKEESIECFREVFADAFPETPYELPCGKYVF